MKKTLKAIGCWIFKKDICIVEAFTFLFIACVIIPLLQLFGLHDIQTFFISWALITVTVWFCDKMDKKINNKNNNINTDKKEN